MRIAGPLLSTLVVVACGGASSEPPPAKVAQDAAAPVVDASASSDAPVADAGACTLTAATSPSGRQAPTGCALLSRDTSACSAAREAQGLSGFWLRFSCRVTLTVDADTVTVASDGRPDYRSNYFAKANPCWEAYSDGKQNPNLIGEKALAVPIPRTPTTTSSAQGLGVMGIAVNGVAIFDNQAAPGDDIYLEAQTFDRCRAHPTMNATYHYHSEPYSITYDDSSFVGVARDGYPIYGRRDPDGSMPSLDSFGGHAGVTIDSPSADVYHYHVSEQTSLSPATAGEKQWFILTGQFRGTKLPCASCMN